MMATMKAKTKACNQDGATGFIQLNCVPRGGIAAKVQKK